MARGEACQTAQEADFKLQAATAATERGESCLGVRLRVRCLSNGQQLKCLSVVDEFTRECLAIDVAGSIRSGRVIEILARLMNERGVPAFIRSDNGPEFVSMAILKWLTENKVETVQMAPGKPWQNGTNESFNGRQAC